ncbi:Uncharacterised protein [Mycolicibacterium vanbaalenii]|uniref:Uncharacterized protein n=1 Tax=Mycolicibacterium vanbaalenii TaxID=110539 RepID=A0A5S9QX85_MYCVN|nr:Uncharacterised protein [Mycolicibacterium vanbaalenii]
MDRWIAAIPSGRASIERTVPTCMSRSLTLASGFITNPARSEITVTGTVLVRLPLNSAAASTTIPAITSTKVAPASGRNSPGERDLCFRALVAGLGCLAVADRRAGPLVSLVNCGPAGCATLPLAGYCVLDPRLYRTYLSYGHREHQLHLGPVATVCNGPISESAGQPDCGPSPGGDPWHSIARVDQTPGHPLLEAMFGSWHQEWATPSARNLILVF